MAGLQDLSDEELLAMAGESPTQEAPQSNLQSLSDEELLALADQTGAATAPKAPEPIITSGESLLRGAAQGITLGFADEISGGIEAALTDKPYEQAKKESRDNFAAAQVANPNAYIIGEVAGGIGGVATTGGMSAGYRGAAIIGGMSGIGFSNRKGSELLTDAAIGTAFGLGGEKVARGIGRYVQKAFKNSSSTTRQAFEELGETTRPENVKFEADIIKDAFNGRLGSADDWVISKEFGRKAQQSLDETPQLMKSIFKDKRKQLGGQIQAIVDDLPTKSVDISDSVDAFKQGLKENLRQSGPDKGAFKTIQREILEGLDDGTFGIKLGDEALDINNMTPMQAVEFKRGIQEIVFAETDSDGLTNLIKNSPRAKQALTQFANEITDRANALDPSGRLREVNRQFSQLAQADMLIPKKEQAHQLLRLQSAVDPTGAGSEMRQLNAFLEGVDPEFRAMTIKEINPRLTMFQMHQAANFKGGSISELFRVKAATGLGSQTAGPIGEVAGGVLALGDAGFINAANAIAKARKAFKVPRSTAGVFANSDIIISKLSQISPAGAIALNDAISDGDENMVEEIMKQTMQSGQAAGQFEDGIGFNGKAVTPEELGQARNQIMSSSMPLSEKIQSVNQLSTDGTLPLPEQLAPRFTQPSVVGAKKQRSIDNMDRVKRLEKGLE